MTAATGTHYLVANLIAIGVAAGWTYLANGWFTSSTSVLGMGPLSLGIANPRLAAVASSASRVELKRSAE